jgi:hypothetical protein
MTTNPERQRMMAVLRELNGAATSLNVALRDAAATLCGREAARPVPAGRATIHGRAESR